jgi:hypothetical protein
MTTNVFYHLSSLNDYKARFCSTYEKIMKSGLLDKINNFFVITDSTSAHFLNMLNVNVIKVDSLMASERPTLMFLKNFALENEGYSLYLHCKGSSRPYDQRIQDWINMLEYFCIEQFERCIEELKNNYNVVGCNFKKDADEPHFSGNFWWANNNYLATLPELNSDDRIRCEMWIGKGVNLKAKTLHDSPINHYNKTYPASKYTTN